MRAKLVVKSLLYLTGTAVLLAALAHRSEEAYFSAKSGAYTVRITIDKKPLENPYYLYEVYHLNRCVVGPLYLGSAFPDTNFDRISSTDDEFLLVVEKHHPDIVLIGIDLKTGDVWPIAHDKVEVSEVKKRNLQQKIEVATGKTYQFSHLNESYLSE